jgi:epsin
MYNQVNLHSTSISMYLILISLSPIQAKNVVLNVSEMEAKVREATNDEPW